MSCPFLFWLVVGREAFPLDGRVGIFEQGFEQLLVDAFAVGAVGEDEDN